MRIAFLAFLDLLAVYVAFVFVTLEPCFWDWNPGLRCFMIVVALLVAPLLCSAICVERWFRR